MCTMCLFHHFSNYFGHFDESEVISRGITINQIDALFNEMVL